MKALRPKNNPSVIKEDVQKFVLSDTLKRLVGSVKLPDNFDYKEERAQRLIEKYIKQ